MTIRNTTVWLGLFFMFVGSVCVDSATGAEPANGAENTTSAGAPNALTAPANQAGDQAGDQDAGQTDGEASVPAADAQAEGNQTTNEAGNEAGNSGNGEGETMFANDEQNAAQPASDGSSSDLPAGQQVNVGSFGQIDLHVKDLALTKVLQLLSIQSKRNIVANRNVTGKISADLYDVGFYEALDAILHTNGFGYKEKDNFIYVYTQAQLAQMEEANRNIESEVVRLNYMTAADAAEFVRPMLSASGSISVSGESPQGMQPTMQDAGANSFAHAATLVIHDYQENIDEIADVLEQLDHRPKQVKIKATVLEARLSEANAFGVDFALFADLDVDDFTTPLGSVNDLISGTGRDDQVLDSGSSIASTPGQTGAGQSSVKLGYMGSDAAVFIKALDSVTDTTVVASPEVLVLNRQRAELLVGQRLGYLSTTNTETSSTQTVEFLDIGTQLTVRPFVSDDGFVRLELRPSVSDGDTELVGGFVIPDQTTQELTTNVMVRSGQTIVLGGLFKEDTSIGRRQVPGLGDIPVIGNAFKGQDDEVQRTEVIFLIKPTIVKDEKLYATGESTLDDIRRTQAGARMGLLPWARAKLTNSHLKKAYEYKRKGNTRKALWHTNLALEANPTMVEALRLKEELSGEELMIRNRSILDSAVDNIVDDALPQPQPQQEDEGADEEADTTSDESGEAAGGGDKTSAEASDEAASDTPEQTTAAQASDQQADASEGDVSSSEEANMEAAMQSTMNDVLEAEVENTEAAESDEPVAEEKSADDEPAEEQAEVMPATDGISK